MTFPTNISQGAIALAALLMTSFIGPSHAHPAHQTQESEKTVEARRHLDVEFDAEVEAALALSGGPEHLRADATVYVYKKNKGFILHREGSNGFTCLLNRDAFLYESQAFKPTCWDAEGTHSYVKVMRAVGQWLAQGMTAPQIEERIDAGFDTGVFKDPVKTGVAFMVAGDVELDVETGRVIKTAFPGHYMFYAPNVTNEQLGASSEALNKNTELPFIFAGGAGGPRLAYLITMIGHVNGD